MYSLFFAVLVLYPCFIFSAGYSLPKEHYKTDALQTGLLYHYDVDDGLQQRIFSPDQTLADGSKLVLSSVVDTFEIIIKHGLLDYPTNILVGIRSNLNDGVVHLPMKTQDKGCYSAGEVVLNNGSGVFVFDHCAKTKNGFVRTSGHHYTISINEEKTRLRRSMDNKVAVNIRKREIKEDLVIPSEINKMAHIRSRTKRQASSSPITVEVAAYLDQDYNQYLIDLGLTTPAEKFQAIILKYASTAALFSLGNQLDMDITIRLTYIEIWTTNPAWYLLSANLMDSRTSFCKNTLDNTADVLILHSKQDQGTSRVKGVAKVGGVCGATTRCAVENTGILATVILAHEIGHLIGMFHNENTACDDLAKEDGIMDSNNLLWNECNRVTLHQTVPNKACLTTQNVTAVSEATETTDWPIEQFSGKLAGQMYSDDQICELFAGEGAWYRTYRNSRTSCGKIECVKQTTTGPVLVQSNSYIPGRYCGSDASTPKVCFRVSEKCEKLDHTGLPYTEVVQGGWSDYGQWSSCTVTCGTGVQYRKRDCNKPVPQNAPYCTGSQYDVRKCIMDMQDCPSTTTSDLADIRASTCSNHGEAVDGTVAVKNSGDGQCEVQCTESIALLPDGTACNGRDGEYYCVQGTCQKFSTDQYLYAGTDYTIPGKGNRETILVVPAGAKDVHVEFVWTSMKLNFLEIWTNDVKQIKVLCPVTQALYNTVENPVYFASTYWFFDHNDQYLKSEQGLLLSEPAVIKVFQRNVNENVGIHFSYVTPSVDQCSTGSCDNGVTWDISLCSCVCQAGYYGPSCASTCGVYCFNGYPTDADCNCMCDASVTFGDNCRCQYPFTGKNCSECLEPTNSLENNCRRTCKPGCGGLDCTAPCEDKWTTCDKKVEKNECDNSRAEKNCQLSCGYCVPLDSPVTCP